ncbi:hypothetical protein CR513_37388, partial [Mucuna pruriens]
MSLERFGNEFVIIIVYVNHINIIGISEELPKAIDCLNKEFEIKDLVKKNPFRHEENDGELLSLEVPYLITIRELIY